MIAYQPEVDYRAIVLKERVDRWDPNERTVHCSACINAVVYGEPEQPMVKCRMGVGDAMQLIHVIRPTYPRTFRSAKSCPSFEPAG